MLTLIHDILCAYVDLKLIGFEEFLEKKKTIRPTQQCIA